MRRTIGLFALAILLATTAIYAGTGDEKTLYAHPVMTETSDPVTAPQKQPQKQPQVDIVIALDTSGSMSGLINAARQKLWDIVGEVAKAQPTPKLRVGLVTYGSAGSEDNGYVVIQQDLTTDLDSVSARLFELSTSGGTEYVARAISRSVKELSWNTDPDALRQIYVAGNESADQDRRISLAQATQVATQKDIFVNAIYCGRENNRDALSWRTVANRGRGAFAAIDHNNGTLAVTTPYDRKLASLSARLNRTYMGYGKGAGRAAANQARQDKNASRLSPSAAATRAIAKASNVYRNEKWDLVDARKSGKLRTIRRASRPAAMRHMSEKEFDDAVSQKQRARKAIQEKIRSLSKKRASFVQKKLKREGKDTSKAFGYAIKSAMRQQAKSKKIHFAQ